MKKKRKKEKERHWYAIRFHAVCDAKEISTFDERWTISTIENIITPCGMIISVFPAVRDYRPSFNFPRCFSTSRATRERQRQIDREKSSRVA